MPYESPQFRTFHSPETSNNNMADARICEGGATSYMALNWCMWR